MNKQRAPRVIGWTDTLMSCGERGAHPLFEPVMIRRAFGRIDDGLVHESALMAAHAALRTLATLDGLPQMRALIASLPTTTVDVLVYLYFRRLDRRLLDEGPTLH